MSAIYEGFTIERNEQLLLTFHEGNSETSYLLWTPGRDYGDDLGDMGDEGLSVNMNEGVYPDEIRAATDDDRATFAAATGMLIESADEVAIGDRLLVTDPLGTFALLTTLREPLDDSAERVLLCTSMFWLPVFDGEYIVEKLPV